jgi:predicted MFS family arabinose efflux permease
VPFIADTISYAVSVVSLTFIATPFQAERTYVQHNLRAEIAEGLSWLWHQPLIRSIAFLTGGLNMTLSATPLFIIVMAKQMGAQDAEIGLIFSISGIGGIAGSIIGGQIQKRFTFGQVIIAVVWIQTLLFPLYAIVPQFFLLGVISGLIYMMGPIYNVVQFSYRLTLIPDHLQGRVNSTFRLLAFGFNPLGAALSGVLLERLGAIPTIVTFSLVFLGLALSTTLNTHVRHARPIVQADTA